MRKTEKEERADVSEAEKLLKEFISSMKHEMSRMMEEDRKIGAEEKRLLERQERRRKRRTLRLERRVARAIDKFSRIVAEVAKKNGYLPAEADQEQQDRSTISRGDLAFSESYYSDSDSSCCTDSSCSCCTYTDSDESTESSSASDVPPVDRTSQRKRKL